MTHKPLIGAVGIEDIEGGRDVMEAFARLSGIARLSLVPTAAFEAAHGHKPFAGREFTQPVHVVSFAYTPIMDGTREVQQLIGANIAKGQGEGSIVALDTGTQQCVALRAQLAQRCKPRYWDIAFNPAA